MLFIPLLAEEPKTGADLTWLVWAFLIVFVVLVLVGWLATQKGWIKKEEEPAGDAHGHDEHGHEHDHAESPATPDDLTKIEGIGPKVAKLLSETGIETYAALAAADKDKVQALLNENGLQYMNPEGWIEQAKLAAEGDIEGLKKLQDSLKGGRKVA
jgi:predicted flap endonuclease-1-like 5' DNA nuclease